MPRTWQNRSVIEKWPGNMASRSGDPVLEDDHVVDRDVRKITERLAVRSEERGRAAFVPLVDVHLR